MTMTMMPQRQERRRSAEQVPTSSDPPHLVRELLCVCFACLRKGKAAVHPFASPAPCFAPEVSSFSCLRPTRGSSANKSLIMFALLMVSLLSLASGAQYVAPGECRWTHTSPTKFDVSLHCDVWTISPQGLNFSLIQTEHTISLTIVCDDHLQESRLETGSLSHLRFLKSLSIINCKLSKLNGGALLGLQHLRNLTIRTHNDEDGEEEGDYSLDITHESLSNLRHLEQLDLGFNNMAKLPADLFCPLTNLKVLNLTHNRMNGFGSLGVVDHTTGHLCLQELQQLDLSHNRITFLSETGVASLKNLRALYLHHNQLREVAELSLSALSRLQVIDLSDNRLSGIPSRTFRESQELRHLLLQNNSFSYLQPGLFSGLSKLVILNLSHNAIPSESFTPDTFADLIRVVILDLGFNRLTKINGSTFQNQYSLQILYLNNNEINHIADNSFAALYNLHTLILSWNRLRTLGEYTLNGLYVLSRLSLDENEILKVGDSAFKNCSNLQDLNLKGNLVPSVPKAISSLRFLKSLSLSKNALRSVDNAPYLGMQHLGALDLSGNKISNFTRGSFRDLPALQGLDLSSNALHVLEHGVFDEAPGLVVLQLQDNLLTDINGLFMNLVNLRTLNVSRNEITWFDYALISKELHRLDLSRNRIETLGNYFEMEGVLSVQWMDVSHNSLKELTPSAIPNMVEVLDFSHNKINTIHPFTFLNKVNLSRVDLTHNNLTNLDMNAFRLVSSATSKAPLFYLASNPYFCDCTMEWLERINNLDSTRQYPRIEDLNDVVCELPFVREKAFLPLVKVNSSNFLCKYKSHCFALCHCCEFDACDCEMMCPDNCSCYYDQSWNTNIVDCSANFHTTVPQRIPMDVSELYLDGNDIPALSSHTFIGRKNMKILHFNSSNIHTIDNRTFNGLKTLQILNLRHNRLTALHGYEFERLFDLKELYLSYNRISVVANNTFLALRSLQILHIDHNYIVDFEIWNLNFNGLLTQSRLSHNMWSCECVFVQQFIEWLPDKWNIISDAQDIQCHFNETTGIPLLGEPFNMTSCTNYSNNKEEEEKVFAQRFQVQDLVPMVVIGASVLVLLLFSTIVMLIYRREMSVWFYSRYGVRLQGRGASRREEEKLFDAFLSYSKMDEAFVSQILTPELEYSSPPYRLCLHYRDLPVASGYLSDAIVEAMEASRRTILVISENFLKGEWCRYEFKSAHLEVLRTNRQKIILIFIGKINSKDFDPDIKFWLKTNTILQWGEKMFWEKLRYAMPDIGYTRKSGKQTRDMTIALQV